MSESVYDIALAEFELDMKKDMENLPLLDEEVFIPKAKEQAVPVQLPRRPRPQFLPPKQVLLAFLQQHPKYHAWCHQFCDFITHNQQSSIRKLMEVVTDQVLTHLIPPSLPKFRGSPLITEAAMILSRELADAFDTAPPPPMESHFSEAYMELDGDIGPTPPESDDEGELYRCFLNRKSLSHYTSDWLLIATNLLTKSTITTNSLRPPIAFLGSRLAATRRNGEEALEDLENHLRRLDLGVDNNNVSSHQRPGLSDVNINNRASNRDMKRPSAFSIDNLEMCEAGPAYGNTPAGTGPARKRHKCSTSTDTRGVKIGLTSSGRFRCPLDKCCYSCDENKRFVEHLEMHMTPYSCPAAECGYKSSRIANLNRHRQLVHGHFNKLTANELLDPRMQARSYVRPHDNSQLKEFLRSQNYICSDD